MPPVRAEGCQILQQQQQPSPKTTTATTKQPMGNIKFTEEETIRLVHAFKARQCLWNREVGRQVGTDGRKQAYLELVKEVGKDGFGLAELKRKIKILRSTYNQEVAKMKKLAEIGYDKHYYPNLKWFHLMHEVYSSEGVDSNRANSPDDGIQRWSCSNKYCRAYFKVSSTFTILESSEEHNHSPLDEKTLTREKLSNLIKRKATEDISTKTHKLVIQELQKEDAPNLTPTDIHLIKKAARRERSKRRNEGSAGGVSEDSSLVRIKEEPPLEVEDVDIRGVEDESAEPPPEAECILGCPPSPQSQQPLDPLRKDGRPLKRSLRDVKSPEKTCSELKVPRLSDQISITVRNLNKDSLTTTDPLSGPPSHQFQEGLGRTTESPVLEQARPFHISLTPIRDLQEQSTKTVPGPATVRLQQSSDLAPVAAGQSATEDLPRRAANDAADQNDKFAEHVAAQLRQLPLRNALKLQEKIQSLITKERLACLQD